MTDTTTESTIRHYFELAELPDATAYLAQFADDAIVEDEHKFHRGLAAIRSWRSETPPVTYAVNRIEQNGGSVDARAELAGEFPGSPVSLTFHFEFNAAQQISALTIRP